MTKVAKSKIMSQCGQFGRYQNPGSPFAGSSDQAIRPEASPNGGFPGVNIGLHNSCGSFTGCFVVFGWVGPSGNPDRVSHFGQTSLTTGLVSLKYVRGKLDPDQWLRKSDIARPLSVVLAPVLSLSTDSPAFFLHCHDIKHLSRV